MTVGDGLGADPLSEALLESDRAYFALGARRRMIGPAEVAWLPTHADAPAGCVSFAGYPGQAKPGATAAGEWLANVEALLRSLHNPVSRIYTPAGSPLVAALKFASYACRAEIGFLRRAPGTGGSDGIRLVPIASERRWDEKRKLHAAGGDAPDGHEHSAADWVDIERVRAVGGAVDWYLVESRGETCGAIGLMPAGTLVRLKNFYIHPDWRRRGIAATVLGSVFARYLGRPGAAVGVFAVGDSPGEGLYRCAGMAPVCVQYEWTREL